MAQPWHIKLDACWTTSSDLLTINFISSDQTPSPVLLGSDIGSCSWFWNDAQCVRQLQPSSLCSAGGSVGWCGEYHMTVVALPLQHSTGPVYLQIECVCMVSCFDACQSHLLNVLSLSCCISVTVCWGNRKWGRWSGNNWLWCFHQALFSFKHDPTGWGVGWAATDVQQQVMADKVSWTGLWACRSTGCLSSS